MWTLENIAFTLEKTTFIYMFSLHVIWLDFPWACPRRVLLWCPLCVLKLPHILQCNKMQLKLFKISSFVCHRKEEWYTGLEWHDGEKTMTEFRPFFIKYSFNKSCRFFKNNYLLLSCKNRVPVNTLLKLAGIRKLKATSPNIMLLSHCQISAVIFDPAKSN